MQKTIRFLRSISNEPLQILDATIAIRKYTTIDFSTKNLALRKINVADPHECQNYIDSVLRAKNALVAFGGYMEKRNLYENNPSFSLAGQPARNIHLGIDFWSAAGTKVIVPLEGKVHSFKNNSTKGDYGPTIVLEHNLNGFRFHTLYGHLSIASLENLYVGKILKTGDELASLGSSDINVGYAPHLHFQVILDMQGRRGDYLGVCSAKNLEFYSQNCPDPNLFLAMPL